MKRTGKLGSIHYNERLVCDLWREITESANAISSKFIVDHNSSSTEFETPEELKNATQIPDRITEFELSVEASEGDLRINMNPHSHQYMIRGEENWVRRMSDFIRDFVSTQENKLRTTLTNSRLTLFQMLILGGLISTFWNKITAIVLPFYYVELTQIQLYIFAGFITAVILLQLSKYIYPTVVFRRRGTETRARKVVFFLGMIGSVLSIFQAVYWTI